MGAAWAPLWWISTKPEREQARAQAEKARAISAASEAAKNDDIVDAGPRVIRHQRDGLTVWQIEIPKQYRRGAFVHWEKCIAVASSRTSIAISCEGHSSQSAISNFDITDDRPVDDVRGQR